MRSEAALLLTLALAACSEEEPEPAADAPATPAREASGTRPEEPPAPLSVVLVTVDTLRREHLGCYGYFRDTTPAIDALAAEGILFERAVAPMASTYPSHLSMLTGLYAHQHGRMSNRDGVGKPFVSDGSTSSAASAFQDAGYRTGAFVSSRVLSKRTGIDDGFETWAQPRPSLPSFAADQVTERALTWLRSLEGDEPFFLWIHYWDTHEPNAPEKKWAQRFRTDAELRGWLRGRDIDLKLLDRKFSRDESVQRGFLGVEGEGELARTRKRKQAEQAVRIDEDRLADLVNRYDGDLAKIDHHLGRLLANLRRLGRWGETVVVFTADHGQSFGEDRSFGHGFISDINAYVPLIVRLPDRRAPLPAGTRVGGVVSLVDLMATVLGRLDPGVLATIPATFRFQLQGEDLFAAPTPERRGVLIQESTRFHGGAQRGRKLALYSERWKYLHREDGVDELYDLDGAGEGVDVAADHPDVAQELLAELLVLLADERETSVGELGSEEEVEELLENLRALGYLGDEDE
jgi:arylsulfatase